MKIHHIQSKLRKGLSRVRVNPKTNCWEWQGALTGGGYGTVSVDAKNIDLHRAMYAIFNGAIPWRHCVMHTCDNRKCINPNHLTVGTLSENALDMWRKKRGIVGEKNNLAKLTAKKVLEIRRLHPQKSYSQLAKKYGITIQGVAAVVTRRNWKHI